MDLFIALTLVSVLYLIALWVSKLMKRIDEHDEILKSDD